MLLNDSFKGKGTYDTGSNISLISKNLLNKLNLKYYKLTNTKFKMISGYGNVIGIAKIKVKIFKLIREVLIFVIDTADFDHDILLGLDLIYEFRLRQNEFLEISQNYKSKPRFNQLKRFSQLIVNSL